MGSFPFIIIPFCKRLIQQFSFFIFCILISFPFFYQIIGQVQKSFHVMTSLFSVSVDERFGSHNKTLSTFPSLFHSTGAQSLYFLLSGLDRCFVSSILGFLTSLSMSLSPCSGSFSLSSTSAGLLLIKLFCFCMSLRSSEIILFW